MIQETSNLDWGKNKTRNFGQALFYTIIIRSINKPLFSSGFNKHYRQTEHNELKTKKKLSAKYYVYVSTYIYLGRYTMKREIINPAIMSWKIKI